MIGWWWMWVGRMTRNARIWALVVLPWLAAGAWAQDTPMRCDAMWSALVPEESGYALTQVGKREEDGWCVLSGASLRAKAVDQPNITAEVLKVRGLTDAAVFAGLDVQVSGLRVTPKLGDKAMDARLQSFLRLMVADVSFGARRDAATGVLALRDGRLTVPGRLKVTLAADIVGVDVAGGFAGLIAAAVTSADLRLATDGSMARPALEAAGERLVPEGAERFKAVAAAKDALAAVVEAMPAAAFPAGKAGLQAVVAALPQPAGEMVLTLRSEGGIGPARLALAGLKDDPLSPRALEGLLRGVVLTVNWTPGVMP